MLERVKGSAGLATSTGEPPSSCHGFVVGSNRSGERVDATGDRRKSTLLKEDWVCTRV